MKKIASFIVVLSILLAPGVCLATGYDTGQISVEGGSDFSIKTNNADRVYIKSTGNVGIGTTEARGNMLSVFGTIETYGTGGIKFPTGTQTIPYTGAGGGITQEADTLDSVLARGNTTTREVTLGGLATIEANTGNIKTSGKITAVGTVDAASYNIAGSMVLAILPGTGSTGVGKNAGRINMGNGNSFVGYSAGYNNTTGTNNSFVGYQTGWSNTGSDNSFIGNSAGYSNTSGSDNSFMGYQAGFYNQSGIQNVIIGRGAGQGVTGKSFSNSTLLGYYAGYGLTTGNNNVFLGFQAGHTVTSGANNIIIGYNKDTSSPTASNELNIGGVIYGNLSSGNVGIGTVSPGATLEVAGLVKITGGSPDTGKVLTAVDNTGLAIWQTAAGGSTPTLDAVLAQGGTSTRDATLGNIIGQTIRTSGGGTAPITPTGTQAVAMGLGTTASGDYSTAMGYMTTATTGYASTAMGYGSIASGNSSTAMGAYTVAGGAGSVAMGETTSASGMMSTAMGESTIASGTGSVAMGNTFTNSTSYSLGIGYNSLDILLNPNGNSWLNADTGNVGIGTASPTSKLTVAGTIETTGTGGIKFPTGTQTIPYTGAGGGITQEADTLDNVVARGSSTTREVTLGGLATIEANTGNIKTAGNLSVSGTGNSSFAGNVGIGTTGPTAKLTLGSGQVFVPDGTAAVPPYSFTSDSNTGIYLEGADTLAISTGGAVKLRVGGSIELLTSITGNSNNITGIDKLQFSSLGSAGIPSLSWTTDTDTGIFSGLANTLAFTTAGSERVRIDATGQVGIGTASPGATLEVAGQVKITGGSPGANKVLTSDNDGLATWQTAAGGSTPTLDAVLAQGGTSTRDATLGKLIVSGTSTSEFAGPVILAKTSGNVGIGTMSPNNAIQVANLVNFDNAKTSTSLGYQAGLKNASIQNTFVGYQAGSNDTSGGANTFVGYQAGSNETTAIGDSFFGANAGLKNTTGGSNTFLGYMAGQPNTTGSNNTFVGNVAGGTNTTGSQNTIIGSSYTGSITTGSSNEVIGFLTGKSLASGSHNIEIGYNADAIPADSSNRLNIGNIIFGTNISGEGSTVSIGNIGIGTTEAANAKLDVNGNIRIQGTGTALPTADASWRGVMYFLQGTLSTTPDKLYLCMQNTNGSYQWVLLEQGD